METSTTKQDTVAKTAGLAMYAVAQHMLDQRLPSPIAIRGPRRCPGADRAVQVDVYVADLDAWIDATDATYLRTQTTTIDGERFALVTHEGRVQSAVGDVSVLIRIAQHVDPPARQLVSLPGGVA